MSTQIVLKDLMKKNYLIENAFIALYKMFRDVLLLADVIEKFINTRLEFYGLDLCNYFSSPGLSWDAMLKITGVKLEKVFYIDMYLFIEKGLGGGISYISKRYSEANNK